MNSLFHPETQNTVLNRIAQLNKTSQPNWGKMSVAQMLKHCQQPLEVANGNLQLNNTKVGFFKRIMFKAFKPVMYNDKAWQKNLGTVREFRITDSHEFETEKEKLIAVINDFAKRKDNSNWPSHPFFGKFTTEQWGKMQYKHLDHHLTQFGV